MPRHSDARQRMIQSAAVLFREQGIEGTSFTDVLAHSGAPRGSIYHHFPNGKTQLATEATEWAGEYILASTAAALTADDPIGAIDASRRWWTKILTNSDYQAGCVIVAATIEGNGEPSIRAAAQQAFTDGGKVRTDTLRRRGVTPTRARSLATLLIAAIEGAVILSRAQRTTTPVIQVTAELKRILTDVLDPNPT